MKEKLKCSMEKINLNRFGGKGPRTQRSVGMVKVFKYKTKKC